MIDENTMIMATGDNRSFAYLQENPKAGFIFMEPGSTPMAWGGARLYLEVEAVERSGEMLNFFREQIRKTTSDQSADAIVAAIRFNNVKVRPLIAPV